MELKPGYRKTEIGVIPDDWDLKPISSIARVVSGKRLPLGSSLTDYPTPFPYIRVTDMKYGTILLSNIKYVPGDVYPSIRQYRIFRDDIFISVAGTLGIVGRVPEELDGANLTENANRITEISCSIDFLLYVLKSPLIQNAIDSIRTVGAQPKLALGRIRKFIIPLPQSKAEQCAIAKALSDTDALLGSLDRLIAKKRNIKQAVMQQLLTGKTRLPKFEKKWNSAYLPEVLLIRKGEPMTSSRLQQGNVPVIAGGKNPAYFHDTANRFGQCVTISASGANAGFVGFYEAPIFASDCSTIESSDYISAKFAYYKLKLRQAELYSLQSGGAQPHVQPNDLARLMISFPDRNEQNAIVSVLSDMDAEIAAIKARREKTRNLKQAMMQELLTGKTRLIKADTKQEAG
ncbi:MAG: restriction endonuclease subunit S [Gammaproteobacteria bacterium]|nr:restriction endonuclease subunit S [Gammaproteobacteria bacterium]